MGNGDGPTEPIAPELIVDEKEKNLHQVSFQANMRLSFMCILVMHIL